MPIVLACAAWGPLLQRQVVSFQCDNMAVVTAVQKGSAKDDHVMHLLRSLWFFTSHYDVALRIIHIAGVLNTAADQLSRHNMSQFFSSNPQARLLPTPLPPELLQIVEAQAPDWTSPAFKRLFNTTTRKVSPRQP